MKRYTKQRAIYLYCLECSGDSAKEVTLCHLFDCPLWRYRCGCSVNSKEYKERIKNAMMRYSKEIMELKTCDVDVDRFNATCK